MWSSDPVTVPLNENERVGLPTMSHAPVKVANCLVERDANDDLIILS